ncbi:hypothetical protein [Saccharothrix obliqua]|uniref:hypothetical protein n=1 Tax=Saccharothrix obliqua TaxID=2861747 RepID=UPI001C5FC63A|nr:hypothetical protein [Saccharothrix obliqua]MBW4718340.1 hypothetical protein [Saccharothrix obliqua]
MTVVLVVLVLVAFFAVGGFAVLVVCAVFMRMWRRAKAKGYTGPVVAGVLVLLGLLLPVGLMAVGLLLGLSPLVAAPLGVVSAVGGTALGVWLLPPRRVRSGARRRPRTPFRVLGVTAVVVSVVAPVALVLSGQPLDAGLRPILPAVFLSYLCFSAARRAARITAPPTPDPRPAVLWIRGFGNEGRGFGCRRREPGDVLMESVFDRVAERVMTFEEYFAPAIAAGLGRGHGLGNPRDYLPPHGVDRDYATDDSWRDRFRELVAEARCVLASPGAWPELRFEFGVVRDLDACRKLFIFTPPRSSARHTRQFNLMRGYPNETWSDFAAALGEGTGFDLGPDPGPGAVVGFDDDGRAVVLTRAAAGPADYVAAVRAALPAVG